MWKTTFSRRRPLVEDKLQWQMTLDGRRPPMEDDLCWKAISGERPPAVKDNLQWKMTFAGSLHAAYSALRHFYWDCNKILLNKLFDLSTPSLKKVDNWGEETGKRGGMYKWLLSLHAWMVTNCNTNACAIYLIRTACNALQPAVPQECMLSSWYIVHWGSSSPGPLGPRAYCLGAGCPHTHTWL